MTQIEFYAIGSTSFFSFVTLCLYTCQMQRGERINKILNDMHVEWEELIRDGDTDKAKKIDKEMKSIRFALLATTRFVPIEHVVNFEKIGMKEFFDNHEENKKLLPHFERLVFSFFPRKKKAKIKKRMRKSPEGI